ncbi:MAG TPA: vanadium-dependent haloperoxidase [Chryseolinea sp.]|nr:vanadium-dependent haloperoxidase [Chryseolinea sp.]
MKRNLLLIALAMTLVCQCAAQMEPGAGRWKTWFITSGADHRLPPPPSDKNEIAKVIATQQTLTSQDIQQIEYWGAGAPGYRWYDMMFDLWMTDASGNGAVANLLMGTASYDATVAAWDTKYAYNRARPFNASNKIGVYGVKPESPSYPCEHSVVAGVAATLISHFYPALKDSVTRMAQRQMNSRIAAGVAYPGDTQAGFDLGKKIAELEIERTKDFITKKQWDGKIPDKPGLWNGKNPMSPMARYNKTVVLDSAGQFRPGPPPDFTKEMDELRNYKQTFRSRANAFHYASLSTNDDLLSRKLFEYNLHLNAPRAARIHASIAVMYYDAFTACWDAKYTYWGIRPDQFDPSYKPLMGTPPFPGYPSGHATMSGAMEVLFSYFFPNEKALFKQVAKDGAESRFQAGIHFRTDNEVGLDLGRKVAGKIVERIKADGADGEMKMSSPKLKTGK